jgi:aspartate/glutamate/glutamine transport system substrate-binding protein
VADTRETPFSVEEEARKRVVVNDGRREFLKLGGALAAGVGAYALAACETTGSKPGVTATAATGTSLLDTWTQTKKAKIGVYVGGSSTGFKDPATGQLKGFNFDVIRNMMKDMGDVAIDFVEFPFPQLFPALAGGQVDMIGQGVTILPSRALKSQFCTFPCYYEGVVMWLKQGSTVSQLSDLNKSGVRISVLAGSSQQFSGALIFPKATLAPFADQTSSIAEVASGRAEGVLISSQQIPSFAAKNPGLRILEGPAVFVDANTFLMPLGDNKLRDWINDWLWYQNTHNVLASMYVNALEPDIAKSGVTIPIFTPDTFGSAVRQNVS